jgi:hypothetical protein
MMHSMNFRTSKQNFCFKLCVEGGGVTLVSRRSAGAWLEPLVAGAAACRRSVALPPARMAAKVPRPCSTAGCTNQAGTLSCPTCVKLGAPSWPANPNSHRN